MPTVRITDRTGVARALEAPAGASLMDALRDGNTGVEGICGGMLSCGTCHVYVDPAWVDRLPPRSDDEAAMLEAIGEVVSVTPCSRLSCQIPVSDELTGLSLEIGPAI